MHHCGKGAISSQYIIIIITYLSTCSIDNINRNLNPTLYLQYTESVFSIKMIMICYVAHSRDAHLLQCGALILNFIANKLGPYFLNYLLYRPH
jgi:hypothetical protein